MVPIAYQGVIALVTDLKGDIVNDLYCDNPQYKQELLHLCIFPLEKASIITMFTHRRNRRYSGFKAQLHKLGLEEKLSLINYLLFLYSEDMFLSGYLDIKSINTEEFKKVVRTSLTDNFDTISKFNLKRKVMNNIRERYSLDRHSQIKNLLGKAFSVDNFVK